MKDKNQNYILSNKLPEDNNQQSRVLARQISRQLDITELSQISGAKKVCDWTDIGGIFPVLDCIDK